MKISRNSCDNCGFIIYLMTFGCSSDSLKSSTSLSAMLKHAANTRLTATSRLSNVPLKQFLMNYNLAKKVIVISLLLLALNVFILLTCKQKFLHSLCRE